MNPVPDPLYLIHRQQAARRGITPLSRDQFSLRLRGQSDTDLTQLLRPQPPTDAPTSGHTRPPIRARAVVHHPQRGQGCAGPGGPPGRGPPCHR